MFREEITNYLAELNSILNQYNTNVVMYVYGGTAMALSMDARRSTYDIDAVIKGDKQLFNAAVSYVAGNHGLPTDWVNSDIEPFLSRNEEFNKGICYSNLQVYYATPEYLLALKCRACRLGEHNDVKDIKYLLNVLALTNIRSVNRVLSKYFPLESYDALYIDVVQDIFDGLDEVYNYL